MSKERFLGLFPSHPIPCVSVLTYITQTGILFKLPTADSSGPSRGFSWIPIIHTCCPPTTNTFQNSPHIKKTHTHTHTHTRTHSRSTHTKAQATHTHCDTHSSTRHQAKSRCPYFLALVCRVDLGLLIVWDNCDTRVYNCSSS
jgi:hypothetical protein